MLLDNKQVAIIGGGPGGLILARLLQQKGANVKVYERDTDQYVRQQGATLDLHHETGLRALREGGLMEAFRKNYRPGAERITITDNNAIVHYSEKDNEPLTDLENAYARPEIDRGPLRDLLIASLHKDTMVWDSKLLALKKHGNGWDILFDDETTAYADLVIAADGANSKARKYITNIERIYSGFTIIEGNIYNAEKNALHLWQLTNGGKVYAHWNGKAIVLSAKGEGSLSFYTITREADNRISKSGIDFTSKENVFTWFKERFSDWGTAWHEIFLTNDSYFVARPQYYFPQDQTWESLSNLTILGDAAHQTPPSGDGVNQAMLDAVLLCEALCNANFNSVQKAIAAYEQEMLSRASLITMEAIEQVEAMLSENNLKFMLDFFTHNSHR